MQELQEESDNVAYFFFCQLAYWLYQKASTFYLWKWQAERCETTVRRSVLGLWPHHRVSPIRFYPFRWEYFAVFSVLGAHDIPIAWYSYSLAVCTDAVLACVAIIFAYNITHYRHGTHTAIIESILCIIILPSYLRLACRQHNFVQSIGVSFIFNFRLADSAQTREYGMTHMRQRGRAQPSLGVFFFVCWSSVVTSAHMWKGRCEVACLCDLPHLKSFFITFVY